MKKVILLIVLFSISFLFSMVSFSDIYAENSAGILGEGKGNTLTNVDLRNGNVDMNTIPMVIVSVTSTLLAIAGMVAIFSLIYHAVQMQINSGIT